MKDELTKLALGAFPMSPIPNERELVKSGYESLAGEARARLMGRTWLSVADAEFLPADVIAPDVTDLFISISRLAINYYIPGFLLHFITRGIRHQEAAFYELIGRLQNDSDEVRKQGGAAAYFPFKSDQFQFVCFSLQFLHETHGDPYEKFIDYGYEYSSMRMSSIAYAIRSYWHF